jgi:hypothetical protein
MGSGTRFAYAQARLQARHGQRVTAAVWQRLSSSGDIGEYLHLARQTNLRPWVLGLHPSRGSHAMEQSLRDLFRAYVDGVARWLPGPWCGVVRRVGHLADLPALQHLLSDAPATAWMQDDAVLRAFISESTAPRREALRRSEYAYLVEGWEPGRPLFDPWYAAWRAQWPGPARLNESMECLGRLLQRQVQPPGAQPGIGTGQLRRSLETRLAAAFRRYAFQPAAACAHLGLVALDLERLRGDLLSRLLFAAAPGAP